MITLCVGEVWGNKLSALWKLNTRFQNGGLARALLSVILAVCVCARTSLSCLLSLLLSPSLINLAPVYVSSGCTPLSVRDGVVQAHG